LTDTSHPLSDLVATDLWSSSAVRVTQVAGTTRLSTWMTPVVTTGWAVTLVRRGGYRRRTDGFEHIVDAGTGFLRGPDEEVSTAAFATREVLTSVELHAPLLHGLPDLEPRRGPLPIEPQVALAHRLLVRRAVTEGDALGVENAVVDLVYSCLDGVDPLRRIGRRPSTRLAHRRLVTDVLEVLNTSLSEPLGLLDVARLVGASPHHLSRVFRQVTGVTLSEHRTRLRIHAVLDRLEDGDRNLATVAAETGFADHAHMARTVNARLGATPSSVRRLLAVPQ
jgi:AraC-like DNA-binding protein